MAYVLSDDSSRNGKRLLPATLALEDALVILNQSPRKERINAEATRRQFPLMESLLSDSAMIDRTTDFPIIEWSFPNDNRCPFDDYYLATCETSLSRCTLEKHRDMPVTSNSQGSSKMYHEQRRLVRCPSFVSRLSVHDKY